MTITFKFTKIDSTASPLFSTEVIDESGDVLMSFKVACDDESQLESIAQEAYALAKNPIKYPLPQQGA